MAKIDARRAIRSAFNNLRNNMSHTYRYGDAVQIFDKKIWTGTFRVLASAGGSNIIPKQGKKIIKLPDAKVIPLKETAVSPK